MPDTLRGFSPSERGTNMDGFPFQFALFGLVDRFLEPFCYGCAGYLISYRCTKAISAKILAVLITSLVFLWMDDIWLAIANKSAKLAMASGNQDLADHFPSGWSVGEAEFSTGEQSGLWDVLNLGGWDILSAALFVPLAFQVGLVLTKRRWNEFPARPTIPPPPSPSSRSANDSPSEGPPVDYLRDAEGQKEDAATSTECVTAIPDTKDSAPPPPPPSPPPQADEKRGISDGGKIIAVIFASLLGAWTTGSIDFKNDGVANLLGVMTALNGMPCVVCGFIWLVARKLRGKLLPLYLVLLGLSVLSLWYENRYQDRRISQSGVAQSLGGNSSALTWSTRNLGGISLDTPFQLGPGPDITDKMPAQVRNTLDSYELFVGGEMPNLQVLVSQMAYKPGVQLSMDGMMNGGMNGAMRALAAASGDTNPQFSSTITSIDGFPARRASYSSRGRGKSIHLDAAYIHDCQKFWGVQVTTGDSSSSDSERILDSIHIK